MRTPYNHLTIYSIYRDSLCTDPHCWRQKGIVPSVCIELSDVVQKFADWVTPNLDANFTIVFNVKYLENGTEHVYLLWQTWWETVHGLSIGFIYSDLEWPVIDHFRHAYYKRFHCLMPVSQKYSIRMYEVYYNGRTSLWATISAVVFDWKECYTMLSATC